MLAALNELEYLVARAVVRFQELVSKVEEQDVDIEKLQRELKAERENVSGLKRMIAMYPKPKWPGRKVFPVQTR